MENLVEIIGLTKVYEGRKLAIDNMNITIPRGKIIGLLGPNGSGKTTMIKMMNGLLTPTVGKILIDGFEPGVETKRKIAYLPEKSYLQNGMKVSQLLDYFADFYEDFAKDKAYAMLQALQIDSSAKLKTLSKGTKEKVQLILVMSRSADLYILDEPIAGVDPAARDYILRTIITNYNENATILLSTHLISDIENILDDVIFIRDGKIILCSTVESIREQKGKSIDSFFREVFAC
jgi:ABC-2 type transport system ATP-binding protein